MKKYISILSIMLILLISGCSNHDLEQNNEISPSTQQETGTISESNNSNDIDIEHEESPAKTVNLPDEFYLKTIEDTYEKIGNSGNQRYDFILEVPRDFSITIHRDNGTITLSINEKDSDNEVFNVSMADEETDFDDTVYLEPGSYSLKTQTSFFRGNIQVISSIAE